MMTTFGTEIPGTVEAEVAARSSSARPSVSEPLLRQQKSSADPQTLDLTVVVPTFNGGDRLPKVIEHLRRQQNVEPVRWEILIVDNNSRDRTRKVAESLQENWNQTRWGLAGVTLRYCFEPRQGLAFARQQAIEQAQGAWVGFIDDDNWPDENWVAAAHRFIQGTVVKNPEVVAFGSCLQASYETLPTPEFQYLEAFLAIRNHGSEIFPFQPEQLQLPAGAGLVVDRKAWLSAVPPYLPGEGKLRKRGEDYAALLYLHRKGGKIAYNPAMKVQHWIPSQRIRGEYLLKLAYNTGLVTCPLRSVGKGRLPQLAIALRTLVGGLKRLGQELWARRNKHQDSAIPALLRQSPGMKIVADFNLLFHLGSALSPLYVLSPNLLGRLDCGRLLQWLGSDSAERSF